jgi:hypothetical protein
MDKLEHFLKKNQHRIVHYFTNTNDNLVYVLVLSIYDGVLFMVDLKDGYIPFVETGNFQKRFYVADRVEQKLPEPLHEQPIDLLIRNDDLLKGSLKVLQRKQIDGNVVIMGSNYLIDTKPDGSYVIMDLTDFPDTLEQHAIFQKYDLDYFYNHKHTISQNVKIIYDRFHTNFLENLEVIKNEWENFSKDPTRHLSGFEVLLEQYNERTKQCGELKKLVMSMYQIWKELSSEYDTMEVQSQPISFDQNLKMNQKKQMLYRKLDRIKLIEKHATDLLVKIHIACTCLMFCIHLLTCEMGEVQFRLGNILDVQNKVQKNLTHSPNVMIFHE